MRTLSLAAICMSVYFYVDKEALEKATVHFLHMSNNQKNIHKYNYCFVMIFNKKNTLEEINLQNPERISKDNS